MKRPFLFTALALFLICIASTSTFAENGEIPVAVDNSYPPYMHGRIAQGLYPKLLKAIFNRMEMEAEVKGYPWKRALKMGESGEAAIGGVYKNEKRLKIYDYSDPIYKEKLAVYVKRSKDFVYNGLPDLAGKRVGINRGWSYGQDFDEAREKRLFVVDEASDNLANFKKLLKGRVDCVISDELSASQIIQREKMGDAVEKLSNSVAVNDAYIVFSKKNDKKSILDKFNSALKKMKEDGSYQKIVDAFILASSQKTISLRSSVWCPYNCVPNSDKPGYFVEIAETIFEKAGYQVEYKTMNWARSIAGVRKGKFTGVVGAVKVDARDFVYPEIKQGVSQACFYVKKENEWRFNHMGSLSSITMATIQDYAYWKEMDEYIAANRKSSNVHVTHGDAPLKRNMQKLLKGRVGTVLAHRNVMKFLVKDSGQASLIKEAGCGSRQDLYIAFSPLEPKAKEYAKLLSDGMKELRTSGRLKTILDSYGLQDWEH